MVESNVFLSSMKPPAATGGWSAVQSIRCIHLDSEAVAVAPSLLKIEGALLKRNSRKHPAWDKLEPACGNYNQRERNPKSYQPAPD